MADGRAQADGQDSEPTQDLRFALPDPSAAGTQPQATPATPGTAQSAHAVSEVPGVVAPGSPTYPKDFDAVDAAQWESIVEHPKRATGRAVVVFAEVARFDSSTGPDRFLAVAGVDQPGATFELQSSSVFIGEKPLLDGVETGDVLKIHAVVTDTMKYETELGGISTIPALTIAQVKDVGFADLSKDFALGAAERDQIGILSVPVTVTNSGGQRFAYSADIVAESKDGSTTYETGLAFVEDLEPGQTVEVKANFFEDVPADAVFRVETAERYIE